MDKTGTVWDHFKIVASHNIVHLQYAKVMSSLKYVRLIIGFNAVLIDINLLW